ncbi:MAG: Asp-tRNA(Asn)/Glu-tRNA(Gln) amidotransferase GatCAB subunit B [Deltaproteobacteria bacterium]|nr:MAG: Asp-tRNA(Asn)/Glu-tRNA(Gln) amidotransferase GatCAB subunit B [Deltaproteobacteria bacterium]
MEFEPVIGLEIHAQLKTRTKIFCGCSTEFGAPPNTHTCPVCLGMPGVLPVLNRKVVDYTLRTALATGCHINRESRFARKNYFYPDLPKGYQISQYELPIAENGTIEIDVNGGRKRIGITRIHMEEDAGKLIHDPDRPQSRVDLNRTGVPLMEIVSEPDLRSPEEAGTYLRQLRSIVRYIGVCDGNMEEGSFRCDANISIRPSGSDTFGTRAEIKNLNSFKHVEKALAYEIRRQIEIVAEGGQVSQETRLWDPDQSRTHGMRGKEEAHDYRYFPDPDLLPLVIDNSWLDEVRKALPELPDPKKARFVSQYGLPVYDAQVLTASRQVADYFEACLEWCANTKLVSNWVMGEVTGLLNTAGKSIGQSPVSAKNLGRLLQMVEKGKISGKIAKTVFAEIAATGSSPEKIVKEKGLVQVSDASALEAIVDQVLTDSPTQVADYKNGKTQIIGYFVGQVMKSTRGQANPKMVNDILKKRLSA